MSDHKKPENEQPWLSLGRFSQWAWKNVLTRNGAVIFYSCSLSIGMDWYADANNPWMILSSPLAIIIIGSFIFLASIVSVFGDSFADWLMDKLFDTQNTNNNFHQFLYFMLSAIGFVLAAYIMDIGDLYI